MTDMSKCLERFLEPQRTAYAIALEKFFGGREDPMTLELLKQKGCHTG